MSELNTVTLQTLVPPSVAARVKAAADNEGLSISAHLRRVIIKWHDSDGETLRLCLDQRRQWERDAGCLVDPSMPYETEGE